jgi:hypothetical protein
MCSSSFGYHGLAFDSLFCVQMCKAKIGLSHRVCRSLKSSKRWTTPLLKLEADDLNIFVHYCGHFLGVAWTGEVAGIGKISGKSSDFTKSSTKSIIFARNICWSSRERRIPVMLGVISRGIRGALNVILECGCTVKRRFTKKSCSPSWLPEKFELNRRVALLQLMVESCC